MRRYLAATSVLVLLGVSYAIGQGNTTKTGKAYRFETLADGVLRAFELLQIQMPM